MYSMFCLISIIFFVNSIKLQNLFQDIHPFIEDDRETVDNNKKSKDKFMLIPSIGYELHNRPGKFTLIVNGWYYEPLKPGNVLLYCRQN